MREEANSKADAVYGKMRLRIINRKYNLGDVLNEQTLAAEFKVSKTPVREAFSRLVEDGYLTKYPRFGYVVKDMKIEEYYQITQLRYILESGCIHQIIAKVETRRIAGLEKWIRDRYVPFEQYCGQNVRFHLEMARLLDNPYVLREMEKILGWLNRDLSRSFYEKVEGDIHINHRAMLAALLERNEAAALAVLREELHRSDDPHGIF